MSDVMLHASTLSGFIGQEEACKKLESIIEGRSQNGVIDHILITGPTGYGKGKLAVLVAETLGAKIVTTSGPAIATPGALIGILCSLNQGDILFVDEFDRLLADTLEYLYSSLRAFEFIIVIDENEPKPRSLRLQVAKFTLIAASTRPHEIGARLRACFGHELRLKPYASADLQKMLQQHAKRIGVPLDEQTALEIACRAEGSPVLSRNLFHRVRDLAAVHNGETINTDIAKCAFAMFLPSAAASTPIRSGEAPVRAPSADSSSSLHAVFDCSTDELSFEASVRPKTFDEYVGQQAARAQLQVMVAAAQCRSDLLDHILLVGLPGLGKTALAQVVASAIGKHILVAEAAEILDAAHLCRLISSLETGDIFLLERIHRLRPTLEEGLRSAMQDAYVDTILDEGPQAKCRRNQVAKVTVIGTVPSRRAIPDWLRSRFGAELILCAYAECELRQIIHRTACAVGVEIDDGDAIEFAKRSDGSPRAANNCIRDALPRLRLATAIARSHWHDVPLLITERLWELAEKRPDFEGLPDWITAGEAAIRKADAEQKTTTAIAVGRAIIRSLANQYGDDEDRVAVTDWESKFANTDPTAARLLSAAVEQAKHLRKGVRRLPLAIHDDVLCVGKHARISFNRTLRIPEDGNTYPLPAGFGKLPILRVEDYAEKLPAKWVAEGGFIIPLYQREALFLEFSGVPWRPAIAKVSVGRVNAVSGKPHDLAIRNHRQDYVVIPNQQWLDGINSGQGSVKQFVAMPLGQGYTIEAQITDEETHGGFQVVVFDAKSGRFPDEDPATKAAAAKSRKERALRAQEEEILKSFTAETRKLVTLLQDHHYVQVAELVAKTPEQVLREIADVRAKVDEFWGWFDFNRLVPAKNLEPVDLTLRAQPLDRGRGIQFMPAIDEPPLTLGAGRPTKPPAAVKEMGIAAGGRIKQQILEDEFGADSWDPEAYRDIVIHLVNSAVFEEITGEPPPETPITVAQYQRYNIPWYSDYDEKVSSVGAAGLFRRIFSVGQIDKERGSKVEEDAEPVRAVTEEEIRRIRVPTLEERVNALVKRAEQSLAAGRNKIAGREASLAVDIVPKHPLPRILRAQAYLRLGYHADAEADASACLEHDPDNVAALGLRARSCLGLGEFLLARNDASKVLESQPSDIDALLVRAQANLELHNFKGAFEDAQKLLEQDSSNAHAIRIKGEAMTKLS